MDDLQQRRQDAADREFEAYEFGELKVGEADGWSYDTPGSEMTRAIWIERDDGPDLQAHFTVRFVAVDSAEIEDAFGRLNGEDIGQRAAPAVAPTR